jgi:hypothetical protein
MKSRLFFSSASQEIEQKTLALLNSQQDFLSPQTLHSPRAAGDAIERILADAFGKLLGDWPVEYSSTFARRAMADISFTDIDGFYYVVDVKTHRTDTIFNRPNLTSVERLARFYEDDANYFVLLFVSYQLEDKRAVFSRVKFVPIEFLSWRSLTIGALGWGQIQLADSNNIEVNLQYPRKRWMLELCDMLTEFYPREIGKITARIEHFEKVREFWLLKPDD